MKVAVIIQARMGSTRLPGKVLRPVSGQPMLVHVIQRALASQLAHAVVVATTENPQDEVIVDWGHACGVDVYRGSADDVLARYSGAAQAVQADVIVRITSDCPLIDPVEIDRVIRAYGESPLKLDYACNILERNLPRGQDTEVFSMEVLNHLHQAANAPAEREHVTLHIYHHPDKFSVLSLKPDRDLSHMRWTVDVPEDLTFVRLVYQRLYENKRTFGLKEILATLEEHPEWEDINRHIKQAHIPTYPSPSQWKGWASLTFPLEC